MQGLGAVKNARGVGVAGDEVQPGHHYGGQADGNHGLPFWHHVGYYSANLSYKARPYHMADASPVGSFGGGLGTIIGGELGNQDLKQGQTSVNNDVSNFGGAVQPYNNFGQSFLPGATDAINGIQSVAGKDPNLNYNTFMSNYRGSPGQTYATNIANEAQNNSAAAKGKLLSGGNERGLATIDTGIANTYANQAYTNYLAGNNQQFGQLESALGNMFGAIGVGTTATGQEAGVVNSQINATSNIAQAQAKNDQSKGSGFGSLFSGLGSMATAF